MVTRRGLLFGVAGLAGGVAAGHALERSCRISPAFAKELKKIRHGESMEERLSRLAGAVRHARLDDYEGSIALMKEIGALRRMYS